jgi:hypothetical protein
MKIPFKLPLDRSGFCELDSSYHIGTIGDYDCSGMKIDYDHSIDDLVLDVWSKKDSEKDRKKADYILNAINNYPKAIEIIKDLLEYVNLSEESEKIQKTQNFLKTIENK